MRIFLFQIFLIGLLPFTLVAQTEENNNVYPTDGGKSIQLHGGHISIFKPNRSGGWARGLMYYLTNGTTKQGGVGLMGNGNTPNYFFMAHGQEPWFSGLGLYVKADGKIGIGTTTPDADALLTVKGAINAHEIKVDIDAGRDYVFYPTYDLPKLEEVEKFIKEKHHLPEIPSEKEMLENGVEVGQMNILLLQKVEELTLYTIEQEKKLKEQQNKLKQENQRIQTLENEMLLLKKALLQLTSKNN